MNRPMIKKLSAGMTWKLNWPITPWLFLAPFIGMYLVFNLFPLMFSFFLSLHKWNGISPMVFIGMENYSSILTNDPFFWLSIKNTLIIGLGYIPLQIAVALVLSVMINSKLTKAKGIYQTSVFLPHITAAVAIGIMCSIIFSWKNGVLNVLLKSMGLIEQDIYWLGFPSTARFVVILIMFWKDLGFICVLFLAGLSSIPMDFYEAAEIDGANSVQRFFLITIPQLKSVLLFIIVNNISWIFQIFDEPYSLFALGNSRSIVGGPERSCLTPVWYMYDSAFSVDKLRYGYASAISYTLFIIIFVLAVSTYLFVRRRSDKV